MKNTNTRDANIFFLPSGDHSPTKETNVKQFLQSMRNSMQELLKII